MMNTFQMMNSILLGNEGGKNLDSLINEYRETKSPNILAYLFTSNFGLLLNISNAYPDLDENDKASFCLQELDNCIYNYDKDIAQFMTYFAKCYKNRLRAENGLVHMNKRKIRFELSALDDSAEYENQKYYDDYFTFDQFKNDYNLTDTEVKFCKLKFLGYSQLDISKMWKQSF